jgi:hypothetical protein
MFELYTDDILCQMEGGRYAKQTGLGTFGHVLTDDEVIFHPETAHMRML